MLLHARNHRSDAHQALAAFVQPALKSDGSNHSALVCVPMRQAHPQLQDMPRAALLLHRQGH